MIKLERNYFNVPNDIVDEYMNKITPTTFKILIVMLRQTLGWQKKSDCISYSQLMEKTGIRNKNTISKCLKELEELNLIIRHKQKQKVVYYINIEYCENFKENESIKEKYEIKECTKNVQDDEVTGTKIVPDSTKNVPVEGKTGTKNVHTKYNIIKYNIINKKDVDNEIADVANKLSDTQLKANEITQYLYDKIMRYVEPPAYKNRPPKLDTWAKDIEKMLRLDGIRYDNIIAVIDYVVKHDFWSINVLSGKALRKYYNRIYLEMKRRKPRRAVTDAEMQEIYEQNKKLAEIDDETIKSIFGGGK